MKLRQLGGHRLRQSALPFLSLLQIYGAQEILRYACYLPSTVLTTRMTVAAIEATAPMVPSRFIVKFHA